MLNQQLGVIMTYYFRIELLDLCRLFFRTTEVEVTHGDGI